VSDPGPTDIKRVLALADALRTLGMSVSAIVVGDVRVVLAEPWGGATREPKSPRESADADQALYAQTKDDATTKKLKRLREASKRQFGKILPDETLLKFDGLLA
jgi:hypothetical protein